MSVTPAQATEAHRALVLRLYNPLECVTDGDAAQLIADSEARAVQQARDKDSQITHAHRNANILLRAEAERLNRIVSKFIATEDGTDWMARAEKAEAELAKSIQLNTEQMAAAFIEAEERARLESELAKERARFSAMTALCKRLTDSAECCVSIIPYAGFKNADGLDALCKEARVAIAAAHESTQ